MITAKEARNLMKEKVFSEVQEYIWNVLSEKIKEAASHGEYQIEISNEIPANFRLDHKYALRALLNEYGFTINIENRDDDLVISWYDPSDKNYNEWIDKKS